MIHPNDKKLSDIIQNLSESNLTPIKKNSDLEKMKPMTYDQIVSDNPPPLEYALFPWLPVQGIAYIFAATGVGKTLFTMNTAYAIAKGGEFLKYKAPKERKVLYVDGEMSFIQLHARFMQIVKQQGGLENKNNFHLLTPDKAMFRLPKICSIEGQAYYEKIINDLGIEVIVFDNLTTLSTINENDAKECKIIQDWLLNLRSKNITSIMVHHAGKDKKDYRGSSKLIDCIDTAISLQNIIEEGFENNVQNTVKFKVVYKKNRAFGGREALAFDVSLSFDQWIFESTEKNNFFKIVEMFCELNMKVPQISKELDLSESFIYRTIKKARKDGILPLV